MNMDQNRNWVLVTAIVSQLERRSKSIDVGSIPLLKHTKRLKS